MPSPWRFGRNDFNRVGRHYSAVSELDADDTFAEIVSEGERPPAVRLFACFLFAKPNALGFRFYLHPKFPPFGDGDIGNFNPVLFVAQILQASVYDLQACLILALLPLLVLLWFTLSQLQRHPNFAVRPANGIVAFLPLAHPSSLRLTLL